ncbi:MAG: hypothetical protein M3R17_08415 [Bacteroidota bacterium]|nr:hypothetical protein [Bacteroidota bacterium]
MWKKLTPKKKNRLLLLGALVLFWLVYSFAIRNTIELVHQCSDMQAQLDSSAGAPEKLIQLKQELQNLEKNTGNNDTSGSLHERLLGIVTNYCQENNLLLRDFASPVRYHQQEWLVETHPLTVEGPYIALLKLVQKLEQEKTGKVVSVDFHSKRDNKTQALSLTVTIYVQNIIHTNS